MVAHFARKETTKKYLLTSHDDGHGAAGARISARSNESAG